MKNIYLKLLLRYRKSGKRKQLARILVRESLLVQEESMKVLAEFEKMEDSYSS